MDLEKLKHLQKVETKEVVKLDFDKISKFDEIPKVIIKVIQV